MIHRTARASGVVRVVRVFGVLLAAGLLVAAAGCSRHLPAGPVADTARHQQAGRTAPRPLAVIKGQHRLQLTITSAVRSSGGFLTVRGEMKNQNAKSVIVPAQLEGSELDIVKNGPSLGGATLVDFQAGLRYYVLRDTDGRPLTTTGISELAAGESVPVYMQFPAPPAGTTHVTFQLPQFDTATLTITG
ncbi:hypothetical protein [Streptomyces spiralis]|uniref:hypothetical protein n=1 Tax=Streptomyces spiralis TaxID=66376 RepID=UPI00367A2787